MLRHLTDVLGNGKKLRCCALRPNGIYGENEKRHLPRIADNIEAGYTIFRFGTGKVYIDWCHVNNLIQVRDVTWFNGGSLRFTMARVDLELNIMDDK